MTQPEQVRDELVRQWVKKADEDLAVAERLIDGDTAFPAATGFHAQQAAEKYLKAYLVRRQRDFPKTHDLEELLDLVALVEESLAESLRPAGGLTPYAVNDRYPTDGPEPTKEEAREAIALARTTRDAISSAIRALAPGKPNTEPQSTNESPD